MTRTRFLWFSVLVLLSACQPRPRVVDFDSSTDIFRGLYRAEVDFRTASSVVGFSADGSRLAMANGDGSHAAQLWDVSGGVPTGVVGDEWYAQSVALTPDGSKVVALVPSAEYDGPGEVQVWDAVTGVGTVRLPGRSPSCTDCQAAAFALSPDGTTVVLLSQRLANGPECEISLFGLLTGERRLVLAGDLPYYQEVRFRPDGSRVAAIFVSDGWDGVPQTMQATLWDAGGGLIGTSEQPGGVQRDPHMWGGDAPVVAKFGNRLELALVMTGELLHTLPVPPSRTATRTFSISMQMRRTPGYSGLKTALRSGASRRTPCSQPARAGTSFRDFRPTGATRSYPTARACSSATRTRSSPKKRS